MTLSNFCKSRMVYSRSIKKCITMLSVAMHYCYIVTIVLTYFRLTKGHVTFFQSKIIVGISLPLMALIKISQSSLLNISFQGVLLHIQNAIGIFLLCVKYCLNKTRQSFSTLIAKQINKYFMNFEIQFKIISKHIIQNFL